MNEQRRGVKEEEDGGVRRRRMEGEAAVEIQE